MKRKCSYIAGKIDREYRIKKRYEKRTNINRVKNTPQKNEDKK